MSWLENMLYRISASKGKIATFDLNNVTVIVFNDK